jgi:hypothetical protein
MLYSPGWLALTREILVAAAEGPVDDLDAGLFGIGIEGVFAERFRDDAAPAVEADLFGSAANACLANGVCTP